MEKRNGTPAKFDENRLLLTFCEVLLTMVDKKFHIMPIDNKNGYVFLHRLLYLLVKVDTNRKPGQKVFGHNSSFHEKYKKHQ